MLGSNADDTEQDYCCSCCDGLGVVSGYGICPLCDGESCQDATSDEGAERQSDAHRMHLLAVARVLVDGIPEEALASAFNVPSYKVEAFVGKGSALSATRQIDPGELILAETPLVTVYGSEDIRQQVVQENEASTSTVDMRHMNELTASDARLVNAIEEDLKKLECHHREEFLTLSDSFAHESGTLGGIFLTNAVGSSSGDISHVYRQSSRINHSCWPNAVALERNGMRHIFAAAVICPGEEICISYIDDYSCERHNDFSDSIRQVANTISLDADMLLVGLFRQQLFVKWGFWCQCRRCSKVATPSDLVLQQWCDF